ncbi:MAG: TonB-dependent receptor, partial [Prolixibacteraceae bacterium]
LSDGRNSDTPFTTQQQVKIKGKVTDSSGAPLPGVTVRLKGTSFGTITDSDGMYSLVNVPDDGVLNFSFVGMKIEEVAINGRETVNVQMTEETIGLGEVIAVGYGTQQKSEVTGAVGKVKGQELKNLPLRSASDALSGKAAGVMVTSTSGSPGSLSAIRIRGVGTVNNTDPLYVVDGLPQTGIGWLNPNDVESIEILKDASATAIYGARAANGVILITTRRGSTSQEYQAAFTFDAYYGIQNDAKRYHMLNAEDFMTYKNLAYTNNNQALLTDFATPENRNAILSFLEQNTGSRAGTDWWKEIMNENAPVQSYNLNVSGGLTKLAYNTSLGYMKQDGIVKGSDYERISWRTNADIKVADWFKLSSNVGIIYEKRHNVDEYNPYTGTIFSAMTADPITPVYRNNLTNIPGFLESRIMTGYEAANPYSQYAPVIYSNKPNPVAQIDRMNQSVWEGYSMKGGLAADINLTSDLTYRGSFGFDIHRGISNGFIPSYYLDGDEYHIDAEVSRYAYNPEYFVFENTLTFDKTFEDHHVLAMVGLSSEKTEDNPFGASKQGLVNNETNLRIIDAASKNAAASGYLSESSIASYFGRLFYAYQGKYMATINVRRDGSSNFDKGKKWGVFPSFSLGWNMHRESFAESISWLNVGKLRVSWGEIGNHNVGGGGQYLSTYSNSGYYAFGNEYTPTLTAGRSQVGNADIEWETTRQTDIGADLELFDHALIATIDWFQKKTSGMLVQVPIPSTMGFPNTPWVNAGSVKNTGLELALTYRDNIGDFKYSVGGNLSTFKNEVISLGGGEPINQSGHLGYYTLTRTEEGMPIGYFYGLKTDGIFQNAQEIASYTNEEGGKIQPNARPGDLRFVDLDKNGSIGEGDRTKTGNPFPDFTYGVNLNFQYKGFDLVALFQGSQGNDILNILKYDIYSGAGWYNAPAGMMEKAWHGEGTSNSQFAINANSGDNLTMSDWYVEDGSYMRLKNLQIGYSLPKTVFGLRTNIENLRIWVGGQNLFTLTGYEGLDPEMGSTNPKAMGIDIAFYPQARTYMMGVNITF